MKIAVIGAGISGMGAAYLLAPHHDVTLFEKNNYIGGHSRTIDVQDQSKPISVDTGFIVFNDWNYPNLFGLFRALNVPYEKSDMSFGASIDNGWLEYASGGLFAQKSNLIRPAFWGMLYDIIRFNKQARSYTKRDDDITLGECLDEMDMGKWFRNYYLLAMGAAIWSCPIDTIMQFPAKTFLKFFDNHGLLNLVNRPQWYTVSGGSREYVSRLINALDGKVHKNNGATKVIPQKDGRALIQTQDDKEYMFDQVILACHADEALSLIDKPSNAEKDILGSFRYQDNRIVTHTDESFMPQNKKCWASWVYLSEGKKDTKPHVSLSYWMNNLQNFETENPVLVTLNPGREPDQDKIIDEHVFTHPIFDRSAINAQPRMRQIQGKRGLWFCGAYQRYGFHEDGLLSAVNVAKAIGVSIPWE